MAGTDNKQRVCDRPSLISVRSLQIQKWYVKINLCLHVIILLLNLLIFIHMNYALCDLHKWIARKKMLIINLLLDLRVRWLLGGLFL